MPGTDRNGFPSKAVAKVHTLYITSKLYTLFFWDFFNMPTERGWKTICYTNKKTTNENITGIWNTPLFNILIQIKKLLIL